LAEETAFKMNHFHTFQSSVTLTLDRVNGKWLPILYTVSQKKVAHYI